MKTYTLAAVVLLAVPLSAAAKGACPAAVKTSVYKAYPDAKIRSCKRETHDGKTQYEVKLRAGGKGLELDVSPDGAILLTEEKIELAAVPAVVTSAFSARYPKATATLAEKQTAADGKVTYELAFKSGGKTKETTFDSAGGFVSEE